MTRADVREANDPWLPQWVQQTWERAKDRYHATPVTERPSLDQMHNALFVFTVEERGELIAAGYWPPPSELFKWLKAAPKNPPKPPPDRSVENGPGSVPHDLGASHPREPEEVGDDTFPF